MTPRRRILFAAVASVFSLWSAEILLARLSSHPQSLRDMLLSLVGLVGLAVVPVAVLERVLRDSRGRSLLFALSAVMPLALVAYAILLPVTLGHGWLTRLAPFAIAGVLAGWRVLAALRSPADDEAVLRSGSLGGPFPDPVSVASLVLGCAVVTWLVHMDGLPPLGLLGLVAVALVGAGFASRRPVGMGVLLVLTLGIGLVPRPTQAPVWSDRPPPGNASTLPDIVYFSIDTLRKDVGEAMRSYREIGAAGVSFRSAQAAAPWTLPSMATLFTGLRPPAHGARHLAEGGSGSIAPDVRTFVEILAATGYDTAGISTNNFLDARRGFDRGFSTFVHSLEEYEWSLPRTNANPAARPAFANLLLAAGLEGRPALFDARAIGRAATAIVEGRREDRPLLLWVHYMDCHMPLEHADSSGLPRREYLPLERGNADLLKADAFWETGTASGRSSTG